MTVPRRRRVTRPTLGVVVAGALGALALLHVFWAVGGRTPGAAVIPEVEGRPSFRPGPGATLAVAAALVCAAALVLRQSRAARGPGLEPRATGHTAVLWLTRLVGLVFVARAIGDFRLVGFFKSVRDTRFAAWDTWLYAPLCLALGVAVLAIARRDENP